MKIVYEKNDLEKLKNVVLSLDVTDNLVTVVISKIHIKSSPIKQKNESHIEVISVHSTEIKDGGEYGKTEPAQRI